MHSAHEALRTLYDLISGPAEVERDWAAVRALFLPSARIRSELALPEGTVQSGEWTVDGFCKAAAAEYRRAGFWEREVAARVDAFGNAAQIWSTYETRVEHPDADPVLRGINAVQLIRRDGDWLITDIVFQIERPDHTIPDRYLSS